MEISPKHDQPHFVLVPLLSPGHLLPMIDMAKLFAQHGVIVSIVTTPLNTNLFKSTIDRAVEAGSVIRLLQLEFPAAAAGLPEGCENMDSLPSRAAIRNFYVCSNMLQQPFEKVFNDLQPRPSCIISGKNLAWTVETARKFGIPRLFFDGMGCFSSVCTHKLLTTRVHESVEDKFEPFVVPGLVNRIELTRAKLPESLNPGSPDLTSLRDKLNQADAVADGILVNTLEELEPGYMEQFKELKNCKVWCIGPVSASNKLDLDKSERGRKGENKNQNQNQIQCMQWLDTCAQDSVLYACLGSICGLTATQLLELGLGLAMSKHPFIWAVRDGPKTKELEKLLEEEDFEEKVKGRGLIVRGWVPQLQILSHPSIGGFLTHCGWNSTTEGFCSGVPIVTCPLFAEQFMNEKLVVDVLRIGVSAGVEAAVTWGMEERSGVVMKRDKVKVAVEEVMGDGEESGERRKRARAVGEMAKKGIEEGGSSYLNMRLLIQDIIQQKS